MITRRTVRSTVRPLHRRTAGMLPVAMAMAMAMAVAGCTGDTSAAPSASEPRSSERATAGGSQPGPSSAPRASQGCGATPAVSPGDAEIHLDADGADRWYLRHVPPGYDASTPMPVVVDIHGYAEGAKLHRTISGLGAFGDTKGFITITPNGQGTPVHWNANLGSADVASIGTILDQVEHDLCVDQARIFVTGYSNGAFMTSAVACQFSERIAAVAPVAGMRDIPGCTFGRPVPAIAFHGTADHFVEFNGGMGPAAAALPAPDGSGRTLGEAPEVNGAIVPGSMDQKMPDIVVAWARRNGCTPDPHESPIAEDVTLVDFTCPTGADVELYRVDDGGHTWPGSPVSATLGGVTGRTTMSIDADELMWAFFSSHPLAEG